MLIAGPACVATFWLLSAHEAENCWFAPSADNTNVSGLVVEVDVAVPVTEMDFTPLANGGTLASTQATLTFTLLLFQPALLAAGVSLNDRTGGVMSSQASPMPLLLRSAWSGLATVGQLSATSTMPSPSLSGLAARIAGKETSRSAPAGDTPAP